MRKLFLIGLLFLTITSKAQTPMNWLIAPHVAAVVSNPFLTSGAGSTLRNDYGNYVGFKFTVGSTPIVLTSLGRWVVSGNSGTHTLVIRDGSNSTIVSASINTSGLGVGYNYVSITPTTLSANTVYCMFSLESSGGDQWYQSFSITSTADATVNASAYIDGSGLNTNDIGTFAYVPVNFKYHL
jgi:hypothetical protein